MSESRISQVFAIDPGPIDSAYLFWDGVVIGPRDTVPNQELLERVSESARHDGSGVNFNTILVIERVAHYGSGMPVGIEIFDTVEWSGRFIQEWSRFGRPVRRMFRREVKMALCGQCNAKDPNIRQALVDRYGEPGTKKAPGLTYGISKHLWAAFALAVTALPGETRLEAKL